MSIVTSFRVRKFLHGMYFTAGILLVIFAILVTTMRLLTPFVKRYQSQIEMTATTALGKPVTIGDINTGWHNFHPVIELNNINILEKSSTATTASTSEKVLFHINSVQISIGIFDSLWERKLNISQLIFDGMQFTVQQDAQNKWHVLDIPIEGSKTKQSDTTGTNSVLTWLFSQNEIAVQNVRVVVKLNQYPSHIIRNLKLILYNNGDKHYLRGQIKFNDVQHSMIDVAANMVGSAADLPHLTTKLYVNASKLDVSSWLGKTPYYGFHLTHGSLSFQLWADWQEQHLTSVYSKFNVQNLQLKSIDNLDPINIQLFSGNALLAIHHNAAQKNNWELTADNLHLTINQHEWPVNTFGFFSSNKQQTAQVDFLQLEDVALVLAQIKPISPAIREKIQHYNPHGQVKNIQLIQLLQPGKAMSLNQFHAIADLQNVSVNRVGTIPGVSHLTAAINITPNNGNIKLNSTHTTFDFGSLFHHPLTFDQLKGVIQWQRKKDAVLIQGLQLNIVHPNMNLQSNFSLLLPNQGSPNLRLLAQFKETDISKVKQFLPISVLAPSAVQWLEQAFVSGDGLQGGMVLTGPLNRFPFFHGEGQFIVHAMVHNINLHFAPDWPAINNLDGELTFNKRAMFFKLQKGNLSQLPIKRLIATIPEMGAEPQAHLYINGDVDLPNTAQAEAFIFNSPLRDSVGKNLAGINLQGQGELHLKLNIPLESGAPIVNGQINLRNNTLAIPSLNLNFTQLTGLLNFTDAGLSSPLVMANFFQQPMTLSIKTIHTQGERTTVFDMNSILTMDTVRQYFALPKLDLLNGTTEFKARLALNNHNDARLKINTNLNGINIALPAPFGKAAEKAVPFSIDVEMKSKKAPRIKLNYEHLWKLLLIYQEKDRQNYLEKVLVHFGSGRETLPAKSGIYLQGVLKHFYWDEWQPIFKTYFFDAPNNLKNNITSPLKLEEINVFVNRVTGFKQVIEQAQIHINRDANAWVMELISPQIDGHLVVPNDKTQPTIGEFKTLYLSALTEGGGADVKKFDPNQMIPLNIHADNFHYGANNFGSVTLQAHPIAHGMQIEKLLIDNPELSLNTKGVWTRNENADDSSFSGTLATNNLGGLLKQQGITDHVKDAKGNISFSLSWPASPADFSAKISQGELTVDFKNGAIIGLSQATNEKIGLGKVLNALSIQNIYDRLTFQNNSIDSEGFIFNEMKGSLTFENSNIFTNDAYINGQVAQIYINGRVGLGDEDLDLLIKVSPYLTSSLPVIATIAGGPLVGAITWAADKVVSVGIEKTVVYQYRITGPITDPVILSTAK